LPRVRQVERRGRMAAACPPGVHVEVIVPRYRMLYRRPRFRFRYAANGKQVSEATACALVEG
jgi:hypothetical protein